MSGAAGSWAACRLGATGYTASLQGCHIPPAGDEERETASPAQYVNLLPCSRREPNWPSWHANVHSYLSHAALICMRLLVQAMKASAQRKLTERQTELRSKQEQIVALTSSNEALRARVAAQPVNKADLNRMMLER